MKKFNEWAQDNHPEFTDHGLDQLSGNSDYGMQSYTDNEIVEGQLEQLANRCQGIMENLSPKQKAEYLERFINELKARLG